MKRLILIILLITTGSQLANAQSYFRKKWEKRSNSTMSVAVNSFRSIRGWKHGVELGYNTTKNVHFGIFSYTGNATSERPGEKYEGVQIAFPILNLRKWSFSSSNRLGIYDKRFVSFLPTLNLGYKANELVTVSTGAGFSDRYPTFDFKLVFHLKKYLK